MATLAYTPLAEIDQIHATLRAGFASGALKPLQRRKDQLLQLAHMIKDNIPAWEDALAKDLGRPRLESQFLELAIVVIESMDAIKKLDKWAKPDKTPWSLNWSPMRPVVRKEPKGVVLIIAPFNYPLFLTLGPLIGAIAAGCAALIKPSEMTVHTSGLLAKLLPQYLDPTLYAVVNGAIPETTRILQLRWDHILYTGNARVAKIVSKAAAEHLTPVSLELGGKSPVFIDPKCDLKMAARRIMWGKMANAGQTCVAPDYILCPRSVQDQFVAELKAVYAEFYRGDPQHSGSFARIISENHFERLKKMLEATQGNVVLGGETDAPEKYVAPTVVCDVPKTDSLMGEEIFGPLLPIVPVADVDEALAFVNSQEHPLALYVFSQDGEFKRKVFDNTQSGAAVANELLLHIGADGLPFGGVGQSGSGGAHTGKFGFDMFTHLRASMDSPGWIDLVLGKRFPPYTEANARFFEKRLIPRLPARDKFKTLNGGGRAWWRWMMFSLALAVSAVWVKRGRVGA